MRLKTLEPHFLKCVHQKAPALVVGFAHLFNFFITLFERFNGRILARRRGAHYGKLVNFGHLGNNLFRPARITEPPARHGIRF